MTGLLKEVCKDVVVEPKLQALIGETFESKSAIIDDDARLKISARSFWSIDPNHFLTSEYSILPPEHVRTNL